MKDIEYPINGFRSPIQYSYEYLFKRFTLLTIVCSILPLLFVGWVLNIHYTNFSKTKIINAFNDQVANHRRFIEQFLQEQSSKLRLVAYTHSKEFLVKNIRHVFDNINKDHTSIMDLGVIDEHGHHLAYVGPYDLLDKNYTNEKWFMEVMQTGVYISDMFMGFRRKPHFIIAVLRQEGAEKWILRATINTNVFRSLVENIRIGETGEVYLVNEHGLYQTTPRFGGAIMEKADVMVEHFDMPVKVDVCKETANNRFANHIVGKAWLSQPHWMLVVKQHCSEAFAEIHQARFTNLFFLHVSALCIFVVAMFITRHMMKIIKKRDEQVAWLNIQLLQASKMASIGELSVGVAHEINNPLAIIMTERQILLDMFQNTVIEDDEFRKQFLASMEQVALQCRRCKQITQNLLRLSRYTYIVIERIDLNALIKEVVNLMKHEARSSGIEFITELDNDLPLIESDISQLQQVLLDIITNAIDAHEGQPYGIIRISTKYDNDAEGVFITIADTGSGIAKEHLDRIFDPFFTTKPMGKGIGLSLSICHNIINQLGGYITVQSKLGKGTEFTIFLPLTNKATKKHHLKNSKTKKGQHRRCYEREQNTGCR